MVCDLSELCKPPSLDSCQKKFLWTHKEIDLAPHLIAGLVLQIGDTEKFPLALGFFLCLLLFCCCLFWGEPGSFYSPFFF